MPRMHAKVVRDCKVDPWRGTQVQPAPARAGLAPRLALRRGYQPRSWHPRPPLVRAHPFRSQSPTASALVRRRSSRRAETASAITAERVSWAAAPPREHIGVFAPTAHATSEPGASARAGADEQLGQDPAREQVPLTPPSSLSHARAGVVARRVRGGENLRPYSPLCPEQGTF